MIPRQLTPAILVLLVATIAGPASAQMPVQAAQDRNQAPELGEYRIGPEDMLQISGWKNEAMSRTVPVRPNGKTSLRHLNDVQAADLTPVQLREVLIRKIVAHAPAREVPVIITEVRNFKIWVIGEVTRPGRLELRSATTVLDLVAMAGALNQFAARSSIFGTPGRWKNHDTDPFQRETPQSPRETRQLPRPAVRPSTYSRP